MNAYEQGFLDKCAELNVNPDELGKAAFAPPPGPRPSHPQVPPNFDPGPWAKVDGSSRISLPKWLERFLLKMRQ